MVEKWDTMLLAGYVLTIVLYEFNNSILLTTSKCGSPRYSLAFYYVIVPWLLIFGTLNAMLIQFPEVGALLCKYIWISSLKVIGH